MQIENGIEKNIIIVLLPPAKWPFNVYEIIGKGIFGIAIVLKKGKILLES